MVLYIILAIIVIILIVVGILFYMRSNKSRVVEQAEERRLKVEELPYEESLSKLTELKFAGETKDTYDNYKKQANDSHEQYLAPVDEKLHNAESLIREI
jgi:septation ring formation regulator